MHMSLKVLECCHLCATLCAHLVESYCQLGFTASPGSVTASPGIMGLGQVTWDRPMGRIADFQGTETYVHYFGEW